MIGRITCALAAAALITGLTAGSAAAGTGSPGNGSAWIPYSQPDVTLPAGRGCDFPVFEHVLRDHERYRVAETYPDGSHKLEEWTGLLVMRFTNTETGTSVVRNLTGRGDFAYGQDGSFSLRLVGGHFGTTLHQGDTGPGPGVYVVSGHGYVLSQDAEGNRVLTSGHGNVENLCPLLAG